MENDKPVSYYLFDEIFPELVVLADDQTGGPANVLVPARHRRSEH